jgi:hypothetical protein
MTAMTKDSTSISAVANRFEDEIYDRPDRRSEGSTLDRLVEAVRDRFEAPPLPTPAEKRVEDAMQLGR